MMTFPDVPAKLAAFAPIDVRRHPLSAMLPALTPLEYDSLRRDIEANGVRESITLHEGQVLDGWHRYSIAVELGLPCPSHELDDDLDPLDLVRIKIRGRHLNQGQIALVEVKLHDWRGRGDCSKRSAPGADLSLTSADMAAKAGVSERTINQAKAVDQAIQAVKQAVADGKLSVKRGAEIAKLPPEQQAEAISRRKPRVGPTAPPVSASRTESAEESPCKQGRALDAQAMQQELDALTRESEQNFKRARRAETIVARLAERLGVHTSEVEVAVERLLAEQVEALA